jgi:site-specific recombinase XerD
MNKKGKATLENYRKILKLKNYADNSISIYSHYISEFILSFNKPALHITSKDIKNYIENYNYSSISKQNQIYSSIKLFAKYILKIKKLNNIILERPKKEKRLPRVIDKKTLRQKILSIKNNKHKAILALAFSTGMRVSEIINLKISHIDSKRMLIHIHQAKGRKDRSVKLSNQILKILREYYKEFRPKNYLFNGARDNPQYSSSSCNKIIKKYIDKNAYMHILRHSCFTALLEDGVDIRIIQKIAGHARSTTTEIYTHVSNNLLQNIVTPI